MYLSEVSLPQHIVSASRPMSKTDKTLTSSKQNDEKSYRTSPVARKSPEHHKKSSNDNKKSDSGYKYAIGSNDTEYTTGRTVNKEDELLFLEDYKHQRYADKKSLSVRSAYFCLSIILLLLLSYLWMNVESIVEEVKFATPSTSVTHHKFSLMTDSHRCSKTILDIMDLGNPDLPANHRIAAALHVICFEMVLRKQNLSYTKRAWQAGVEMSLLAFDLDKHEGDAHPRSLVVHSKKLSRENLSQILYFEELYNSVLGQKVKNTSLLETFDILINKAIHMESYSKDNGSGVEKERKEFDAAITNGLKISRTWFENGISGKITTNSLSSGILFDTEHFGLLEFVGGGERTLSKLATFAIRVTLELDSHQTATIIRKYLADSGFVISIDFPFAHGYALVYIEKATAHYPGRGELLYSFPEDDWTESIVDSIISQALIRTIDHSPDIIPGFKKSKRLNESDILQSIKEKIHTEASTSTIKLKTNGVFTSNMLMLDKRVGYTALFSFSVSTPGKAQLISQSGKAVDIVNSCQIFVMKDGNLWLAAAASGERYLLDKVVSSMVHKIVFDTEPLVTIGRQERHRYDTFKGELTTDGQNDTSLPLETLQFVEFDSDKNRFRSWLQAKKEWNLPIGI